MDEIKVKKRGFATMTKEAVAEIARKGGRAAHENGRAHRFTSEEAREAGRKGGQASRRAQLIREGLLTPARELVDDIVEIAITHHDGEQ